MMKNYAQDMSRELAKIRQIDGLTPEQYHQARMIENRLLLLTNTFLREYATLANTIATQAVELGK